MRLKEARERGEMFYTGKVCKRHPELKGRRRASNGNCHACICERMSSPHSRALARNAYHRRQKKAANASAGG
jgi:hypothetical protein